MKGQVVVINEVEYTIVHQTLNGYICIDALGNNKVIPVYIVETKIKEGNVKS